ncbi:MAG: hypothetical protein QW331_01910 [Candidatus Woesearchaeota archaeon]
MDDAKKQHVLKEDMFSLPRLYPQVSDSNWASGGGLAVYYAVSAERCENRQKKKSYNLSKTLYDKREFKDFDIVIFTGTPFGFVNKQLPRISAAYRDGGIVEVDVMRFLKERPRWNYDFEEFCWRNYKGGVSGDVMRGTYFGFHIVPTEKDSIIVVKDKVEHRVLSPEFLIASKLFNTGGMNCNDITDIMQLFAAYHIKKEKIWEYLQETPFKEVLNEEDVASLSKSIPKGELFERIKERIKKIYGDVPIIYTQNIPYSDLVALLDVPREQVSQLVEVFHNSFPFVNYHLSKIDLKNGITSIPHQYVQTLAIALPILALESTGEDLEDLLECGRVGKAIDTIFNDSVYHFRERFRTMNDNERRRIIADMRQNFGLIKGREIYRKISSLKPLENQVLKIAMGQEKRKVKRYFADLRKMILQRLGSSDFLFEDRAAVLEAGIRVLTSVDFRKFKTREDAWKRFQFAKSLANLSFKRDEIYEQ